MLLVDKLNKGKLPEKPQGGEPGAAPSMSSLTVKPQNIAARVPNIDRIKKAVHERLITALGGNSDTASTDMVQRRIGELVDEYCQETNLKLTKHDREELAELIMHDTLGLGPLESLLEDPEVSEIMVNGPKTIFAERRGRLAQSELVFEDERQLRRVIDRIVARIGRRLRGWWGAGHNRRFGAVLGPCFRSRFLRVLLYRCESRRRSVSFHDPGKF